MRNAQRSKGSWRGIFREVRELARNAQRSKGSRHGTGTTQIIQRRKTLKFFKMIPVAQINDPDCVPQHGSFIPVVGYYVGPKERFDAKKHGSKIL